FDFGFTRSIDETFRHWPKEVLLEDAVRIIRRFRPQVVVATFSGTARDGHGQHQASGIIAREAFAAAGDAQAVPGLAHEGLTPWAPAALFRSTYFDRESATIHLPTGGIDPLTGHSYFQMAMASRSRHRSQDMGMLQPPGPNETRVAWLAGGTGVGAKDVFDGSDTRLRGIAGEVTEAGRRAAMEAALDRVQKLAEDARRTLTPATLSAAVGPLGEIVTQLRGLRAKDLPPGVSMLLDEKIAFAEQ